MRENLNNPDSCATMTEKYWCPLDRRPTFAQLKGKFLSSVPAGVKMCPVQESAHIMDKHFITSHREVCACAFPFHQL